MNNDRAASPKPFLRWAGGKRHLVQHIVPLLFPISGRYFEPFLGAGAVLLSLPAEVSKIGSDTNEELISAYLAIRENAESVAEELMSLEQTEAKFYEVRNWDRDSETWLTRSVFEKTARLIFLNRLCFNGLYRVNSKNQFNVPWGKRSFDTSQEIENLLTLSRYMNLGSDFEKSVDLRISNYKQVVEDAQAEDVVYFDPPYDPSSASASFVGYQANGFDADDQRELSDIAKILISRGVKVVLSNADTNYIRELYSDADYFRVGRIESKRPIAACSASRAKVSELLIAGNNVSPSGFSDA